MQGYENEGSTVAQRVSQFNKLSNNNSITSGTPSPSPSDSSERRKGSFLSPSATSSFSTPSPSDPASTKRTQGGGGSFLSPSSTPVRASTQTHKSKSSLALSSPNNAPHFPSSCASPSHNRMDVKPKSTTLVQAKFSVIKAQFQSAPNLKTFQTPSPRDPSSPDWYTPSTFNYAPQQVPPSHNTSTLAAEPSTPSFQHSNIYVGTTYPATHFRSADNDTGIHDTGIPPQEFGNVPYYPHASTYSHPTPSSAYAPPYPQSYTAPHFSPPPFSHSYSTPALPGYSPTFSYPSVYSPPPDYTSPTPVPPPNPAYPPSTHPPTTAYSLDAPIYPPATTYSPTPASAYPPPYPPSAYLPSTAYSPTPIYPPSTAYPLTPSYPPTTCGPPASYGSPPPLSCDPPPTPYNPPTSYSTITALTYEAPAPSTVLPQVAPLGPPLYDNVDILGSEMLRDQFSTKYYTNYIISITTSDDKVHTHHKRFREFVDLEATLVRQFPYMKDTFKVQLPPKKIIASSLSPKVIAERRALLAKYLLQLRDIPGVSSCTDLRNFFSWETPNITEQYVLSKDIAYSLKLLSGWFGSVRLRNYAVARIALADDSEFGTYLLQLVQALRYEAEDPASHLPALLISRAIHNPILANYFHWHLNVEKEDTKFPIFTRTNEQFKSQLHNTKTKEGLELLKMFMAQASLINFLSSTGIYLSSQNVLRQKKVEMLREMLGPTGKFSNQTSFPPVRFPLDPSVLVHGLHGTTATLFKSAMAPIFLEYTTVSNSKYPIIFKKGDDLRQDQLITKMIEIMDRLLQQDGIDLRLTPYKILATSKDEGFVEFVPSTTFAKALEESSNNLKYYFINKKPDSSKSYGFSATVMDNFVRSCAGYCVITYLLGIGDRHLDNVLLTDDGKLFHIDFGFILDENPPMKFAPPMKLCKEMIDMMGGTDCCHYNMFLDFSCAAYSILRRHADLIVNLFVLMIDSGLPALSRDRHGAISKLLGKFRLDLDDSSSSTHLKGLITESVNAILPQFVEQIHKWAQQRRN
eukprot:Phypoly_transcript_01641.p1 GENE.Phypoly_transcript_01641~~Phypoly_transcript_01641.p1  ORF type:complete len:1026 (+),score=163.05 Phypoly_transcript_01641:107-3184(+)